HEAVAVDPATGTVYMTEDRPDGLLYRYQPEVLARGRRKLADMKPGDLAEGGTFEALRIPTLPKARTQNYDARDFAVGASWPVDWVAIPNREPDIDCEYDSSHGLRAAATSTRAQGFALGCAQFARNEGITHHRGSLYFCATNGGHEQAGQVWRLDLA